MRSLVRRLKGLASMTGLWVTITVPLGLMSDAVRRVLRGGVYDITNVQYLLDSSFAWALQGFASGLIFAALVSLTERGGDATRISVARSVVSGFMAGGLGALGGFLLLTGNTFTGTPIELIASLAPFMVGSALVGAAAGFGVAKIARDEPTPLGGDMSSRGTLPMPSGVDHPRRETQDPARVQV